MSSLEKCSQLKICIDEMDLMSYHVDSFKKILYEKGLKIMIISALHQKEPKFYNLEAIPCLYTSVGINGAGHIVASLLNYNSIVTVAVYSCLNRATEVLQQIQDAAIRGEKIYVLPAE